MEYIKICKVCGKVWCYNDSDVNKSTANSVVSTIASIGSIASAIDGSKYDMYEMNKFADRAGEKIKDFSRCPYCNSTDIEDISKEEYNKIINKKSAKKSVAINSNASLKSLIKRIEIFIEDEEFDDAEIYCNQALDIEPENGYIWLLKLVINNEWKINESGIDFNDNYIKLGEDKTFKKVKLYGEDNPKVKKIIEKANEDINLYYYKNAKELFDSAETIEDYEIANSYFKYLKNYKNSKSYVKKCTETIEDLEDFAIREIADKKAKSRSKKDLEEALEIFSENDWKDSKEKIEIIKNKIAKYERTNTTVNVINMILLGILLLCILMLMGAS